MEKQNLSLWQGRLDHSLQAYSKILEKMDDREKQYAGSRDLRPTTDNDLTKQGQRRSTHHVYNITAENIEAEIDSSIPMPKVTPLRKEDERLARMIENMLRNEIDRLPTEKINDLAERIAKKQGGVGLLPEWDHSSRTHNSTGANSLKTVHPKQIIPQDGVYDIDEMDYFFLRMPTTKAAVRKKYGVDVQGEEEKAPELRDGDSAEDMVTVEIAFYRNEDGGVGRFVWVGDTVCEDLTDCNARQLKRCKKCGQTEIDNAYTLDDPTLDGTYPENAKPRRARKDECRHCHSRSWERVGERETEIPLSDLMRKGVKKEVIQELTAAFAPVVSLPDMSVMEDGLTGQEAMPTPMDDFSMQPESPGMVYGAEEITVTIPYYQPDSYPLSMMLNVMGHNSFLGESDCDKIADQQNTINRISQKILDKLVKAGKKIALTSDSHIRVDSEDNDVWYVRNLTDLSTIKDFDFTGDVQQEMAYYGQIYAEAQRLLGITESFLGRRDATAQSGKAKEFAAAQTAGRLESKRILKKWAWSQVYERMFKNMLAYADERRPVHFKKATGEMEYDQWNRYDFLEIDEAGELWWNDLFLFSCDDASGLASNREAMWQETTAHLQSGAFGNPAEVDTLIIYWTKMEELHYPGAAETKALLKDLKQQQQQQQALMMQLQQQQAAAQPAMAGAPAPQMMQGG